MLRHGVLHPAPAPPPVDATLTRIDHDLRIENDAVARPALLTIDVMRDVWTRVQIPAGLMVRDARLDGQPVPLVEGPPPHVLLSRSGRVVLTLDISLALSASAGTESIALPASAAPISGAVLTLPRSGIERVSCRKENTSPLLRFSVPIRSLRALRCLLSTNRFTPSSTPLA